MYIRPNTLPTHKHTLTQSYTLKHMHLCTYIHIYLPTYMQTCIHLSDFPLGRGMVDQGGRGGSRCISSETHELTSYPHGECTTHFVFVQWLTYLGFHHQSKEVQSTGGLASGLAMIQTVPPPPINLHLPPSPYSSLSTPPSPLSHLLSLAPPAPPISPLNCPLRRATGNCVSDIWNCLSLPLRFIRHAPRRT